MTIVLIQTFSPSTNEAPALCAVTTVLYIRVLSILCIHHTSALTPRPDPHPAHSLGPAARRRRQQQLLQSALGRILEALQPPADRAAAGPSAAGPSTATGGGSGGGGGGGGGGGLLSLSVTQMATLAVRSLSPEARRALEADLGAYVGLATSLRQEMLEMPAAFAAALLGQVGGGVGSTEYGI